MITLEVALTLVGWAWGCLFFGLWVGERGRRMDAQRREGAIRVDAIEPAIVMQQGDGPPDGMQRELSDPPSSFIQETMAETGCSEAEAAAEWRRLVTRGYGEGGGGWTTELP